MKIKLNLNKKLKKENKRRTNENNMNQRKGNKESVKEYKFGTENISARLTTSNNNVMKLELGQNKKRTGYVDENKKEAIIIKYLKNFLMNENKLSKNHYRLLIAMTLLATLSVALVIKNYKIADLEDFVSYSLDNDDVIQASSSIDTGDVANEAVFKPEVEVSNVNTVVKNPVKKEVVEKLVFTKPLDSEISKIFSSDKVIYSKTLELWKTHDGIDIKGDIGSNVVSIEKGKIEKVYEDSFLGYTVVIDHGQGYKSSYSNLSENIPVKQGEIVIKGEVIGQISNTAIGEIKDESHLHFMLIKDGNIIDPTYIMKN